MSIVYHDAEYKSGFQKYIRRQMVDEAVACGLALFRSSPDSFVKRIVTVCIEDVNWVLVADTVDSCKKIQELVRRNGKDLAEQIVIRLMRRLASAEKEKVACWVGDFTRDKWAKADIDWRKELVEKINDKDQENAAGIAVRGLNQDGYKEVFLVLERLAIFRDNFAIRTIDALKWRAAKSARAFDTFFFVQAGALALSKFDPIIEKATEIEKIDWFCIDGHCFWGKIAIGRVAKKTGLDADFLSEFMFTMESLKTGKLTKEEESYQERVDKLKYEGWLKMSKEKAESLWKEIGPQLKEEIEGLLEKKYGRKNQEMCA